jgi:8-oxo-dGTP diphosphatase
LYAASVAKAAAQIPEGYDPRSFPPVAVTVDIVVTTIADEKLQVLLIERGAEPFEGRWALPGGFIRATETLDRAAERELKEETGVDAAAYLQQLGAYGDPDRDPRMRIVTVAYLAVVPRLDGIEAGSDARRASLVPVDSLLGRRPKIRLAFDHLSVLRDGIERTREMLETTSLATAFVQTPFTLAELRGVYEAAWGQRVDPGNFRRKVLATPGFVVSLGTHARPGSEGGKPPELFRAGRAARLSPPLRRPGSA